MAIGGKSTGGTDATNAEVKGKTIQQYFSKERGGILISQLQPKTGQEQWMSKINKKERKYQDSRRKTEDNAPGIEYGTGLMRAIAANVDDPRYPPNTARIRNTHDGHESGYNTHSGNPQITREDIQLADYRYNSTAARPARKGKCERHMRSIHRDQDRMAG